MNLMVFLRNDYSNTQMIWFRMQVNIKSSCWYCVILEIPETQEVLVNNLTIISSCNLWKFIWCCSWTFLDITKEIIWNSQNRAIIWKLKTKLQNYLLASYNCWRQINTLSKLIDSLSYPYLKMPSHLKIVISSVCIKQHKGFFQGYE